MKKLLVRIVLAIIVAILLVPWTWYAAAAVSGGSDLIVR